ncbi:hypothetical protein Desca_0666 [Desulfotomaculum nigrificans CO-1-SRB]|uniref:Uncharacterized protein n=1 Tax=Desulfotomaculum nigrificans (strain DSM 14880 / VKM B-2319 / CO-1-SRB) TaxID=868595 RepID=F6B8H9_DESCC|nr:hypothetical protein [Desulfotomaculum nigrificans]AEF93551.1 hypothetical protein Desca_0666 [Desulfotomaculum nigrificans CO-1-SRB]
MPHLTEDELLALLTRLRKEIPSQEQPLSLLTPEEQELLKMYIPMQLSEESAKRMMKVVTEVREGKRPPLTDEEKLALNRQSMDESLVNFLVQLGKSTDEEFEGIVEMCKRLRDRC